MALEAQVDQAVEMQVVMATLWQTTQQAKVFPEETHLTILAVREKNPAVAAEAHLQKELTHLVAEQAHPEQVEQV